MASFKFDIRSIFTQPIIKVSSNLLPHTFRGDRRMALDVSSKVSEIINHLGELSAVAQKLSKPVTSAQKLRMSENQTVYLIADLSEYDGDVVVGLLKVGTKNLYLFDSLGQTRKVDETPCILDFYIHESRQRTGLGKKLFDIMLTEEGWIPVKCSIDRPSEKLLQFLKKHYGLENIIPQANKFVLYQGFFEDDKTANRSGVGLNYGFFRYLQPRDFRDIIVAILGLVPGFRYSLSFNNLTQQNFINIVREVLLPYNK